MIENTLFDKWSAQPIQGLPRTKECVLSLIEQAAWDNSVKEHLAQIVGEYNRQNPRDTITDKEWERNAL